MLRKMTTYSKRQIGTCFPQSHAGRQADADYTKKIKFQPGIPSWFPPAIPLPGLVTAAGPALSFWIHPSPPATLHLQTISIDDFFVVPTLDDMTPAAILTGEHARPAEASCHRPGRARPSLVTNHSCRPKEFANSSTLAPRNTQRVLRPWVLLI